MIGTGNEEDFKTQTERTSLDYSKPDVRTLPILHLVKDGNY